MPAITEQEGREVRFEVPTLRSRFEGRFELLRQRIVGERHLKMTVRLPGADGRFDAEGLPSRQAQLTMSSTVSIMASRIPCYCCRRYIP